MATSAPSKTDKAPAPPAKPAVAPAARSAADPQKKQLLTGLVLILAAFLGICFIFYVLNSDNSSKTQAIQELNDDLTQLEAEKKIVEGELENLKIQGDSIKLNKLVVESERIYGNNERTRKEGLLWMDKESQTFVVTLGALNGLTQGSRLTIYDADKKVGSVVVELPMDVISYVKPADKSDSELTKSYYRAVFE